MAGTSKEDLQEALLKSPVAHEDHALRASWQKTKYLTNYWCNTWSKKGTDAIKKTENFSYLDIGAMDIAQRLELQTLPSIGYRVHIYYEASTT